jgi:hypothetical protein
MMHSRNEYVPRSRVEEIIAVPLSITRDWIASFSFSMCEGTASGPRGR